MFNDIRCSKEMEITHEAFINELKNIRTGRVSPDILKSIIVDSYGSSIPLTQLANINNLDNMTLSITLWDASLIKNVEKNLLESNLGVTPQTDGQNIILKFPELTSERRKEIVKIISDISEKFKVSLRNIRRKYIDEVRELEKNKSLSIDESKKFQDIIQSYTDNFVKKIDVTSKSKESEILKI